MNVHPKLAIGIEEYRRCRERLLSEFPELGTDDQTLADVLDGETDVLDGISALIRSARRDKKFVKALGELIDEECERKRRLQARAEARLAAALQVLEAIGEKRLRCPDFTATVIAPRPAVRVTNPDALPDQLCRVRREPNLTAIREALERGEAVEGACMSNSAPSLTVRVR